MISQEQSVPMVLHAVTLVNEATGDEKLITVWSKSDSFADVHFAVSRKRAELGLKGYQIFDAPRVDGEFAALMDRMGAGAMIIQLRNELSQRVESYHPDRQFTVRHLINLLGALNTDADAIDHGFDEERLGELVEAA